MSAQGFPGIGGSLGQCCVCGGDFVMSLLLNSPVQMVGVDGIEGDLCVHTQKNDRRDCFVRLQASVGSGWQTLPDGPLRRAFEEATA